MFIWPTATLLAFLLGCSGAFAQIVIEPEACMLDALKSGAQKESIYFVHVNCMKQYLRAVEKMTVKAPVELFSSSTMQWYALQQASPHSIAENIVVNLKNDSPDRVLFADVVLYNTKTKWREVVRAFADTPIESRTIGTLSAQTNSSASQWTADWGWGLEAVYVLPR